ncbi:hypothetical protein C8J56DRAFT_1172837 [Mycena floridula]|nr:hypothetical protein C8J56DRAFT_1172837 [Mycena floridula]
MSSLSPQSFAPTVTLKILNTSIGVMLLGVLFSAILFGITIAQLNFYLLWYSKDRLYLKLIVIFVVFLDAFHLALVMHAGKFITTEDLSGSSSSGIVYYYSILNYNNPLALQYVVWSSVIEAIPTAITACIVQAFYAYRIWGLSKSYVATGLVALMISATLGCGLTWLVKAMQSSTFLELREVSPITITINALSAGVDFYIVVVLCFLLYRARTGFKKSNKMISRLIMFMIETGILTTFFAIGSLVAVATSPNSLIYSFFYFCIGRLYSNSLLAALNARQWFRATDKNSESYLMRSLPAVKPATPVNTATSAASLHVYVETTHERMVDGEIKFKRADENEYFGTVKEDEDKVDLDTVGRAV